MTGYRERKTHTGDAGAWDEKEWNEREAHISRENRRRTVTPLPEHNADIDMTMMIKVLRQSQGTWSGPPPDQLRITDDRDGAGDGAKFGKQ